jgi:hypothetical protein
VQNYAVDIRAKFLILEVNMIDKVDMGACYPCMSTFPPPFQSFPIHTTYSQYAHSIVTFYL